MKSLKHLNKYILKYRWRFILGILFISIANIFGLLPAQVIRHAFDTVKEAVNAYHLLDNTTEKEKFYSIVVRQLFFFGATVFGLAVLKGFFTFLMRQTIIVMSRLIEYDLKNEIYAHYQKLDVAFYKSHHTGDMMNRISEDVSRVRMYLGPSIMYSINIVVLFVLVISTMFSVNAELTLYVLLPFPLLLFITYYVSQIINKKSEKVQRQLSHLSTFVQETFSGIRVIKAYTREEAKEKSFAEECNLYKNKSMALVKVDALFQPAIVLLVGISTIFTIYIGGMLTFEKQVTAGNIAEFIIYINMLTWPISSVSWVTSLVQRAAASQERINEFLNTQPQIYSSVNEKTTLEGNIVFKEVSFTYPDSGIKALDNVSFEVEQGKTIAIIGRTGSGKSTIAQLLCRLYDAQKGEITIGNVNIQSVHLASLREQIGYAPQDVFLFSDTIANNIYLGYHRSPSEQKTMDEIVKEAAKTAVIYSNIIEFPNAFNTMVGERGVTLSGGQKQRVAIARAIINNPPILIFDDCFSAVDIETENTILTNLKNLIKNKTSVIISHRTSTAKEADHILVLEEGKAAEWGTHAQLLANKGIYYSLHQQQLQEKS